MMRITVGNAGPGRPPRLRSTSLRVAIVFFLVLSFTGEYLCLEDILYLEISCNTLLKVLPRALGHN